MLAGSKLPKSKFVFLFFFLVIVVFSIFSKNYFVPTNNLNYFPYFSPAFEKVENSLLADPVFQFEPWRQFTKNEILSGRFPLWNSLNGAGSPFFANMQSAVLYPLNFLYYIFPLKFSLNLIHLFKIFLYVLFTYIYLRSLKLSEGVSYLGAFAGGSSTFLIMWLMWPHTNVFILFTLLLFLTEKIKESSRVVFRYYLAIAVSYTIAIFGGHPETLFHLTVIHVFYLTFRLWDRKKVFKILVFIFLGFLGGAVQLIPFFEYLKYSYVFNVRLAIHELSFTPILSFVVNFIPFFLGAPHASFYKPFETTNFQEIAGGYTGAGVLTAGFIFAFKNLKNRFVLLWSSIIFLSWSIVYGIPPFSLISCLPLFNIGANGRLIAFSGFGGIVLFCLFLDALYKRRINIINLKNKIIVFSLFVISAVLLGRLFFLDYIIQSFGYADFLNFLADHILYIVITSCIIWIAIIYISNKKFQNVFLLVIAIAIGFQTTLLFWNYNPVQNNKYYPKQEELNNFNLKNGQLLETGNPSISQDINLLYRISHAQNYDAMEVNSYRKAFDNAFPIKNQWGKVDEAMSEALADFGIKYVISDYDLNLDSIKIQPNYDKIINYSFKQKASIFTVDRDMELSQIRLLTANYNRANSCSLSISIFEKESQNELTKQEIKCLYAKDFMFLTINFPRLKLLKDVEYLVNIELSNTTMNNSIGLWSDNSNKPYLQLLFATKSDNLANYKLKTKTHNSYIWEVPNSHYITTIAKYKILFEDTTKTIIRINSPKVSNFEIKRTNYPGWNVRIDGKSINLDKESVFISFNIPDGEHVIEISYKPISFIVGLLMSLLSVLVMATYYLRCELKSKKFTSFKKKYDNAFSKLSSKDFSNILLLACLLAFALTFLSNLFINSYLPSSKFISFTTSINWLTTNHHSLTLDYIRISLFGISLSFSFLISFIIVLWKKNQ